SSRRRHTRSKRDWSSDVCSSDLGVFQHAAGLVHALLHQLRGLLLALAGAFDGAGEVFELAVQHAVQALDEAAGHLVDQAHLLLRSEERRVGKGGTRWRLAAAADA